MMITYSNIRAQQTNNTQFKTKILQVFQNLNKNRIPHGVLLDFGMEFTNINAFNGIPTDSTYTTSQTISDVYKTLLMSRARQVNTGFISPQEYATRWFTQRSEGIVILSGQYFKYSKFRDDAYPSKINYFNNQFSDKYIGGVWQNPYEEKQLFVMAPSVTKHKGLNFKIKIPSNLFFSNYPTSIQTIQINFSDGLGYRTVNYNQLINVSYDRPDIYIWKYKITLTNGQSMVSHSKVQIEKGLFPPKQRIKPFLNGTKPLNVTRVLNEYSKRTISASIPYLGHYGSATIYIRYANGGNTITKPLIVAEGFDTGVILNPEQEAGDNNIDTFLRTLSSSFNLRSEMSSYDIIYVDWNNGVDFIQRNAFVFEEVIKWVNQNKVGSEKNVILGQSMGGLIARYALRDIEINRNFNHDTRLYISHDTPHLGANAPLSIQYSARHLRNQYLSTPIPLLTGEVIMPLIYNFAEGFSNIINIFGGNTSVNTPITPLQAFSIADVPAARQMQYTWVGNNYQINNTIHNIWQNEYTQMGYPQGYSTQPIRNIAIANGSECGIPQIDRGNILSYIKDAGRDTFLSNYIGIMDAIYGSILIRPDIVLVALLPGKSYWQINFQSKYMTTLNQNKNIYHGSIKYKKKILWFIPVSITITNLNKNQPYSVLPYDIYGGGWQSPPASSIPLSSITTNRFSFVPTASALDIGKGIVSLNDSDYRSPYVGGSPPSAPKNTLFDNFVTHFNRFDTNDNNSFHISFNRRNGNWLTSELNTNNTPLISDCSDFCSNSNIIGNNDFCSSSTYSLSSNNTPIWNISNGSNIANMTLSGNSVTLNRIGSNNGIITLTATINSFDCGNITLSKQIAVGTQISVDDIDGALAIDGEQEILVETTDGLGNDFQWKVNGVTVNDNGNDWVRIYFSDYPCINNIIVLSMRKNGICGWSNWVSLDYSECEDDYFKFSSNPMKFGDASNKVLIVNNKNSNNVQVELFTISIFNKYGREIYSNKTRNLEFDISHLAKGFYIVKTQNSTGNILTKKLIIR